MALGYIIARVEVSDPEEYAKYTANTADVIAAHGGRFLVRGGRYEALEGEARSRNVVIEFPSFEAARAFYESAAYRAILPHALAGSVRDMLVVEGV